MDTASWTVKARSVGYGAPSTHRLDEGVTLRLDPQHGYVTLRGSLPRYVFGTNGEPWDPAYLIELCDEVTRDAERAGWFSTVGEWPYRGTFKRLDVVCDLPGVEVSALLENAGAGLLLRSREVLTRWGYPAHSAAILRENPGRAGGRVLMRAYDKGREMGGDPDQTLRLEVQLNSYRCKKAEGEPERLVAEAAALVERWGWWGVLDG